MSHPDIETVFIAIDVETTGLIAHKEHLLEVAVVPLDINLNELDAGFEAVASYSPSEVDGLKASADPVVLEMHTKTGLWDKLSSPEAVKRDDLDTQLLAYIKRFSPIHRQGLFLGSSLRLDMNFVDEFLPKTAAHMHYRNIDVSGMTSAFEFWGGHEFTRTIDPNLEHTAMADIRQSIEFARQVRDVGKLAAGAKMLAGEALVAGA